MEKPKFIVSSMYCARREDAYRVGWQINPHMKIGEGSYDRAREQHRTLISAMLEAGAEVLQLPYVPRAYDSVFMKDNAVVVREGERERALVARFATPERQIESWRRSRTLPQFGVEVYGQAKARFEGGDLVAKDDLAFLGYGFRTDYAAVYEVEDFLGVAVTPLELVDPYFYHLDTALALASTAEGPVAFAVKSAFSPSGWKILNSIIEVREVPREEALRFALNWIEIRDVVLIGSRVPQTSKCLQDIGKTVQMVPLDQFQLAGGSAACLVSQVHGYSGQETATRQSSLENSDFPFSFSDM